MGARGMSNLERQRTKMPRLAADTNMSAWHGFPPKASITRYHIVEREVHSASQKIRSLILHMSQILPKTG